VKNNEIVVFYNVKSCSLSGE